MNSNLNHIHPEKENKIAVHVNHQDILGNPLNYADSSFFDIDSDSRLKSICDTIQIQLMDIQDKTINAIDSHSSPGPMYSGFTRDQWRNILTSQYLPEHSRSVLKPVLVKYLAQTL